MSVTGDPDAPFLARLLREKWDLQENSYRWFSPSLNMYLIAGL